MTSVNQKPIRTKPVPWCPDCGALMKLRKPWTHARVQFTPFWGCSQYPDCRGRRNILADGLPEMELGE